MFTPTTSTRPHAPLRRMGACASATGITAITTTGITRPVRSVVFV